MLAAIITFVRRPFFRMEFDEYKIILDSPNLSYSFESAMQLHYCFVEVIYI